MKQAIIRLTGHSDVSDPQTCCQEQRIGDWSTDTWETKFITLHLEGIKISLSFSNSTKPSFKHIKHNLENNPKLHRLCLTSFCDWSKKNSRHSLNQSDAKLKPTTTWSPAFSRALGSLVVVTLNFQWLFWLVVVITLVWFYDTQSKRALYSGSDSNTNWQIQNS